MIMPNYLSDIIRNKNLLLDSNYDDLEAMFWELDVFVSKLNSKTFIALVEGVINDISERLDNLNLDSI